MTYCATEYIRIVQNKAASFFFLKTIFVAYMYINAIGRHFRSSYVPRTLPSSELSEPPNMCYGWPPRFREPDNFWRLNILICDSYLRKEWCYNRSDDIVFSLQSYLHYNRLAYAQSILVFHLRDKEVLFHIIIVFY